MSAPEPSDATWASDKDFTLSRPFLDRIGKAVGDAPQVAATDGAVRPYFITGGRTRSRNQSISFETIVALKEGPALVSLTDEARAVATRAAIPHSMAELSALLRLPIGVVWVLAGDLADNGYLEVYAPPPDVLDDVELIDSLIEGLRRI